VIRLLDLARVRAALAALDSLVARFPHLKQPANRERLAKHLDERKESEHGTPEAK
jgi:hypothetical protein